METEVWEIMAELERFDEELEEVMGGCSASSLRLLFIDGLCSFSLFFFSSSSSSFSSSSSSSSSFSSVRGNEPSHDAPL